MDIFAPQNKLDLNRLFGGSAGIEIANLRRDLIKRLTDGALEIFWDVLITDEIRRKGSALLDGNVPNYILAILQKLTIQVN